MVLSGKEIRKRNKSKDIVIKPYHNEQENPNSYDLLLFNELYRYTQFPLDVTKDNPTKKIIIPPTGFMLEPNILYLGRTFEYTESNTLVPRLDGKSSIARLGVVVHFTAGFGDIGFKGFWTLEIQTVHPILIKPFMRICQISYETIDGEYDTYHGKYQNNTEIQSSKSYLDFEKRIEKL